VRDVLVAQSELRSDAGPGGPARTGRPPYKGLECSENNGAFEW